MKLDIFNPHISTVAKGLDGKVILVYGNNSTGKTKQATRMKKPFYLGFEEGIRAISGVPFLPINNWRDFKKINKQLTNQKTLDKAKDMYQTIVFDEVYTAAKYCQEYICNKFGVKTIGEGNNGFGLWKEYEDEFWTEINKLLKTGFTLLFIGHVDKDRDTGQIIPKGDARSMQLIRDNADIIVYLKSNGVDEDGKVINSSAYLAETEEFFARTRFDYMDTYIENYTAETLEKVIAEGIEKQEEIEGIDTVSFEEQQKTFTSEELDYDELMEEVKEIGVKLVELDLSEELQEIADEHLGKDAKITEATKKQTQVLSIVLDEMKDLLEEAQGAQEED